MSMPLLDRVFDSLDEVCKRQDTQERLQRSLLDPAAAYLARKLFRYTMGFAALLMIQTCLLVVLIYTSIVNSSGWRIRN